ncbi:hypothetical protein V2J09_009394 [Rumex salicifolius]
MVSAGKLEVLLVQCKSINDTEFLAKMDPYVIIRYGNQECTSSVAKGQGKNPVWKERFRFDVDFPTDQSHKYKLKFWIMDKHKYSCDDFDGEAEVYVKDVIMEGMEKGTAELKQGKYRVVLQDKRYAGEISVGVQFAVDHQQPN